MIQKLETSTGKSHVEYTIRSELLQDVWTQKVMLSSDSMGKDTKRIVWLGFYITANGHQIH